MRPVERGAAPGDFGRYRDAARDLMDRLGEYCSYCERRLETHLAVEHVRPKSLQPELETTWENFLLGCTHCNSAKGDADMDLNDFVWPDSDNTLRAFSYSEAGTVSAGPEQTERASRMILLVGLDKVPGHPDRDRLPSESDRRWFRRFEIWQRAIECRQKLSEIGTDDARDLVVEVALGWGGFSIWMTVFEDDEATRRKLVNAFPGTAQICFDVNASAVARPGGKC